MRNTKLFILLILALSAVACRLIAPEPAALPVQQQPPKSTPEPIPLLPPKSSPARVQPPPARSTPVPSPSPVYYNLDLLVKNPDGQAIPGASAEVGDQSAQAGLTGIVSLGNLSAGMLSVTVSAEGYRPKELTQTLQPGDNQIEVVLEPDPFGLLLNNACNSNEYLLYLEDFQDGQAQGWDAIESQLPGWSIGGETDQPGNKVATARGPDSVQWAWYNSVKENQPKDTHFEEVVWRVQVKTLGMAGTNLNFRFNEKPSDARRYVIAVGDGGAQVLRIENDQRLDLGPLGQVAPGEWHMFEIGYFADALTVFLDGEQKLVYQETQPWVGGAINLEPHPEQGATGRAAVFYDNLTVCGLAAPPTPLTAFP